MNNSRGFAMMDFIVAFGVVMLFITLMLNITGSQNALSQQGQTASAQYRIVSGVRTIAGNPSALRNTMRAVSEVDHVSPANPLLLACAGGNPINACPNQQDTGLILYAPLIKMSGPIVVGVQPVTGPTPQTALRFDAWGIPCAATDTTCPILVSTTFRSICGPLPQTAANLSPGALTLAMMLPQSTCTIADSIDVTYRVQLDPALAAANPSLAALVQPVMGSVSTLVSLISGNVAQ